MSGNNSVNESQTSNSTSNRSGTTSLISVSVLKDQIKEVIDLSKSTGVEESKIVKEGFVFMSKVLTLKTSANMGLPLRPLASLTNPTPSTSSNSSSGIPSQSASLTNTTTPSISSVASSGNHNQSASIIHPTPILSATSLISVSVLKDQIKEVIDLSKSTGVEDSKIVKEGFVFMSKVLTLKASANMGPTLPPTVASSGSITQSASIINTETEEKVTKWIQSLPSCETIN